MSFQVKKRSNSIWQTQNLPDCLNCHLQWREREECVYYGKLEGQSYKIFLELLKFIDSNSTSESVLVQIKSVKHWLDTK